MALDATSALSPTTSEHLNKLHRAVTGIADDIGTATTSDIVVMLDASAGYTPKYADSANVFELMGITASADDINGIGSSSSTTVAVGDEDTTILAANSGKPHLVANVSADRTFTLPTAADGLDFEFIATVVAQDGHDWIIDTGSDTNYFLGGIFYLGAIASPNGSSNSIMQVNVPDSGTTIRVTCDGTHWVVSGLDTSTSAPTFADQP